MAQVSRRSLITSYSTSSSKDSKRGCHLIQRIPENASGACEVKLRHWLDLATDTEVPPVASQVVACEIDVTDYRSLEGGHLCLSSPVGRKPIINEHRSQKCGMKAAGAGTRFSLFAELTCPKGIKAQATQEMMGLPNLVLSD